MQIQKWSTKFMKKYNKFVVNKLETLLTYKQNIAHRNRKLEIACILIKTLLLLFGIEIVLL